MLLDRAQRLGRGGVTGKDHQRAALSEEVLDGLQGEVIDHLEGARAVGCTCVVPEVDIVVLGELLADRGEDGQASVA